jgi:hypothetical protein
MMFLKAVSAGRRRYPIITDGLKLYLDAYNLDSYSGSGGTWTDLSNSGYNFTITGPTWTTSGDRRYFEFDGVNDYMIGSASTTLFDLNTTGFTWSIWIYYVTSPAVLDALIFSEFVSGTGIVTRYYDLDNRNTDAGSGTGAGYFMGIARFGAGGASVDTRTTYAETVPTGSWFQLNMVFIYNSSTTATYKIYKNGVQVVTENHSISGTTWTDIPSFLKPVVGAASINSTLGRYNNIRVGEITNYNRPLSATEIDNNYQSTKSNYGL